jgi:hypothetical protein
MMTDEETVPMIPQDEDTALMVGAIIDLANHAGKQIQAASIMIEGADKVINQALAQPNTGRGSLTKVLIPIMRGRRRYLIGEQELWQCVEAYCRMELDTYEETGHLIPEDSPLKPPKETEAGHPDDSTAGSGPTGEEAG